MRRQNPKYEIQNSLEFRISYFEFIWSLEFRISNLFFGFWSKELSSLTTESLTNIILFIPVFILLPPVFYCWGEGVISSAGASVGNASSG